MFFFARHIRLLLCALCILAVTAALLLTGMALFLHRNPQALAHRLADALTDHTGMACTVGTVDVVLLPMPSLALADVYVSGEALDFSVAYAMIRPALLPLLRGEFVPGGVTLLRPQLRLRLSDTPTEATLLPGDLPWEAFLSALPPVPNLADALDGTQVSIMHGDVDVSLYRGLRLTVIDLGADVRLYAPGGMDGSISVGGVVLHSKGTALGRMDALLATLHGQPRREVSVTVSGRIPREGADIPFALEVQGHQTEEMDGMESAFAARLTLEEDSLSLRGTLQLNGQDAPRLEGSAEIQRLSLTRWFGFARQWPSGLQHALDHVHGHLDFSLNAQGLDVPRLFVTAADGHFSGRGGVDRWAEPVILLELAAPRLTLGLAFPEAEGYAPVPPVYAYSALTPEPGSVEAQAMPGPDIGYDITLRVEHLDAWKLEWGDVAFRCQPGEKEQVLMTVDAGRLHGGRGEGRLLLRPAGRKSTPGRPALPTGYAIKVSLRHIQAHQLLARWGSTWMGGRLAADADVTAQGRTITDFFTSLDGYAALKLENGFMAMSRDTRQPFTRLFLEGRSKALAEGASGRTIGEVGYVGQWKATLDAPHIKAAFQAEGPLLFSANGGLPIQMRKIPGHLSLTLGKDITHLQEVLRTEVSGRFSLHTGSWSAALEDGQASLWGMTLKGQGNAMLGPSGFSVQGRGFAETADARRAVRAVAPTAAGLFPPGTLGQASLHTAFAWGDARLALRDMTLKLDGASLRGSLEGSWKNRPQWICDMSVDTLNIDRYLPAKKKDGALKAAPWSLQWLRDNDIQGSLRVDTLHIHKFTVRNVRFPLRIQGGVLECAAARGNLYGAPADLSLRAEATGGQGLQVRASLEAEGVDMLSLSAEKFPQTALGGRATLWTSFQGTLRTGADVPAALSGAWRMRIRDGFLQGRNAQGAMTGSRTLLGTVQAHGTLDKGVLHSDAVSIAGGDMTAGGGGWLNLSTNTLDVNLLVSTQRLHEVPVRYYGSLDNPQRSVDAGRVIVDTLGTLGSGVLDAVGTALGGVLRILQ